METPVPPVSFESFGLRAPVLSALKALGYEEPTPIQRETIPALLSGRDVLGQAATGTGKTAAFALPLLEKVKQEDRRPFEAQALVLVPTRELAMQVTEAVQKYGAGIGVTALAVYGGQEIFNQVKPLKRGVDVVVATPGRALDHIARKTLLLKNVKVVVLDEADEMLDMGFEEDLQSILNELPAARQTALFSATLPSRIAKIAEKHLSDPVRVSIAARSVETGTLPKIRQAAYVVPRKLKEAALMRVLEWETPASAIVFCRTRNEVEALTHVLMRSGYEPAALHGGLTQEQRDQVLKRFKDGAVRVLVATDVAARGLHVENLSHVINFDLPTSPEVYVHRIGRTGRAGKDGVALSFLDPRERRLLQNVERQIKKKVSVEPVPTRQQLDARRAETVANQVKAALTDARIADFSAVASTLGAEDLAQVAGAAMWLLHQKLFPATDSDGAEFTSGEERGSSAGPRSSDRGAPRRGSDRPPRERGSFPRAGMTALTLSLGTRAGVRPQDLVGAIANEADLPSKQISGIEIEEFSSKVEVPTDAVEKVIAALHATKIRGRKVRAEVAGGGSGGASSRDRAPRTSAPRRAAPAEARASSPRSRASAPRRAAPQSEAPAPREETLSEYVEAEAQRALQVGAQRIAERDADELAAPPKPSAGRGAPRTADKPRFGGKPFAGDKPRFGGKPSFDRDAKPRFGSDKPRFGSKPSFGSDEKPRFGSDKPRFGSKPSFGGDEKPRFGSDKPRFGSKPSFGGDEKPRFGSDKPRFGSKPSFGGDEKPRFNSDKPRFGNDDKPRFGGKPSAGAGGSRFGSDKPRFGGKPSAGASGSRFGAEKPRSSAPRSAPGGKPARRRMDPHDS